jgi:hypothetical protein
MRASLKHSLFALATAAAFAVPAHANEIVFQEDHSTNWQAIAPTYGSISGVLDVSYADPQRNTNNLRFWADSYSGRPAAFAGDIDAGSTALITLTPLSGNSVRLDSFFLGSYVNLDRGTSYFIDDLATPGIDFQSGATTIGALGLTVARAFTSATGIRIGFGPTAYNVGINNINFTINPVPEPESYALLLAGLGLMGAVARRKSRQRN